jgi:pyruvate dehydrogenase E2 component (dihydrolipoamide acetyltransferase)
MPISELILPRTSDAMSEAVLSAWLVADEVDVTEGDVVAEVETDKATVEVTADNSGLLVAAVPAGASVEVGGVLAFILTGQEISDYHGGTLELQREPMQTLPQVKEPGEESPDELATAEPVKESVSQGGVTSSPSDTRLVSSPLARKLAKESGVDLASLAPGSGPGGRIVRADIETAAARLSDGHVIPLSQRQRVMAAAMVQSRTVIPHFSVVRDIPVDHLIVMRQQMRQANLDPPSLSAFFVRALALAMQRTPTARLTWVTDGMRSHAVSAIGLAIADGETDLLVPVIRDAESKSLRQVGQEIGDLSEAVKAKRIRPEQLQGAIGTISNLGMFGIDSLDPIIPPGQTFIIGIGRARTRLLLDDSGRLAEQSYVRATLAGDHRVMTGLAAAQLLAQFSHVCENPILLIDQEVSQS